MAQSVTDKRLSTKGKQMKVQGI